MSHVTATQELRTTHQLPQKGHPSSRGGKNGVGALTDSNEHVPRPWHFAEPLPRSSVSTYRFSLRTDSHRTTRQASRKRPQERMLRGQDIPKPSVSRTQRPPHVVHTAVGRRAASRLAMVGSRPLSGIVVARFPSSRRVTLLMDEGSRAYAPPHSGTDRCLSRFADSQSADFDVLGVCTEFPQHVARTVERKKRQMPRAMSIFISCVNLKKALERKISLIEPFP